MHEICTGYVYCSVAQSCPTLWDSVDSSMPDLPILHHLLEIAQTHGHWVGDAIQPSRPLSSPSPCLSPPPIFFFFFLVQKGPLQGSSEVFMRVCTHVWFFLCPDPCAVPCAGDLLALGKKMERWQPLSLNVEVPSTQRQGANSPPSLITAMEETWA